MFRICRILQFGSNLNNYVKNSGRTLYSLSSLGLDGYIDARENVKGFFSNDADKFREQMTQFVEYDQNFMAVSNNLKNMVHLADANEKDLQLLEKMIRKFQQQSKEVSSGNFIFDPVVMRFFHYINNADVALQLFKDPEFDGFFDQLMSYQVLLDMLYEHGRYQDVIDVFQIIKSKQTEGIMYPKHVVMLVFAACHRENTPESFKFATELLSELNRVVHTPIRRFLTFVAALAIKQNAPDIALEIVQNAHDQQYITVRNIKVLAFANLGRPDDAFRILKLVLETDDTRQIMSPRLRTALQRNDTTRKHSFTRDVIDNLKAAVNKSSTIEFVQKFNRLEKALSKNGHIVDKTLDDILTAEIDTRAQNDIREKRRVLAARYMNNAGRNTYNERNNGRNTNYGYKK